MTCINGISYIVKPGDTLYLVAQKKLGDGNRWPEIKNPDGSSPATDGLQPGQELCLPASVPGNGSFGGIVSRDTYEGLFPNRNALYSYDRLIAVANHYPKFCNDGSSDDCRREAAAFLAHVSHETGGLVFVEEQNTSDPYCDPSNTTYPCTPGKTYHGRGPLQLSWNYNYGACGSAIGNDLLNYPELVATDSMISFMTALWFWMTAQPPKSSCHDAIRTSGFGETINIINGAIECGKAQPTPQAQDRVRLYQQYAAKFGASPSDNLYC
jgi:predicted chitinase